MTFPPPGNPPPPVPPPPPMPPGPGGGPISSGAPSNGAAVAALVCGILGFFTCGVTGVVALFIGIGAKKRAKELGGEGSGQATAGIVLGLVSIFFTIAAIALIVLGAFAAENEVERSTRSVRESVSEFEKQTERNGKEARTSHYEITEEATENQGFGYFIWTAFIENTADFETGFIVSVTCEGDQGDLKTSEGYSYSLSPGDRESLRIAYSFDQDSENANCEIKEVTYSY